MRYLFFLLCLPLLGLDNIRVVRNNTATVLTSHPIPIPFNLAKGEVWGFPKPYATPSTTLARQPVNYWQADVKTRWRDGASSRNIIDVQPGDTNWQMGTTLTNCIEASNDVMTCTFPQPHGLKRGDRMMISGAASPADPDLNRDHYIVVEDTALTPNSIKLRTHSVTTGTYTYGGIVLTHIIDPMASGQCRIKSPSHRLEKADWVTITGVAGITVNGSWYVSAVSKDEFIINTVCTGVYGGGGTVTGPDFGSVQHAVVTVLADVPSSGYTNYDVVSHTNRCHLGTLSECNAAGTNVTAMLDNPNWNARIEATAVVVAGSEAMKFADARTMLAAWNGTESPCGPRYWLKGPVVTQLILEYACNGANTYDFGWQPVMSAAAASGNSITNALCKWGDPGCTATDTIGIDKFVTSQTPTFGVGARLYFDPNTYTTPTELMLVTSVVGNTVRADRAHNSYPNAWSTNKQFGVLQFKDATADEFKTLHPSFTLTAYSGWSGVRVEVRMENPYWERLEAVWYAPTIKTGASLTTRWSRGEMLHSSRARWRKVFRDGADDEFYCAGGAGTDPDNCATTGGGTRARRYTIDHNYPYMQYAGFLPAAEIYDQAAVEAEQAVWMDGVPGNNARKGWLMSDKGDVGVQKIQNVDNYANDNLMPLLYLGEGTSTSELRGGHRGVRDMMNGDWVAEGWWPGQRDGFMLNTHFNNNGYEYLFGTTVPGGGGQSEVHQHLGLFVRTLEKRPCVAGWPDLCDGRLLSTHSRPYAVSSINNMWLTAFVAFGDAPGLSCANTYTPGASVGSTLTNANIASHCSVGGGNGESIPTMAKVGYDQAHRMDFLTLAWLMTGEEWYSTALMLQAGTDAALGYSSPSGPNAGARGRNPGKITAGSAGGSFTGDLPRIEAFPMLGIAHGWMAAPTELLWGQDSTPERNLLTAYLWDYAHRAEGYTSTVGGWSQILYPVKWSSDCTGFSSSLTSPLSSDIYRMGKCMATGPNELGNYVHVRGSSGTADAHINWTVTSLQNSNWQMSYPISAMNAAHWAGFPGYQPTRVRVGRFNAGSTLNTNWNPFLLGYSRMPQELNPDNHRPQTFSEWMSAFTAGQTTGQLKNDFAFGVIGYPAKSYGSIAQLADTPGDNTSPGCTPADRPPSGCTSEMAYNWWKANIVDQHIAYTDPRWLSQIRKPSIDGLVTSVSSGTAKLRWIAPDSAVCTVAFNPTSSLDSGDSPATAVGRMQSFTGSANAGDVYRITCGATARLTGTL